VTKRSAGCFKKL